jgi:hypothetical protein
MREVVLRWLTSMHLLPVAFPLPGSRKHARLTRERKTRSYFLSDRASVGSIRCRSSLRFTLQSTYSAVIDAEPSARSPPNFSSFSRSSAGREAVTEPSHSQNRLAALLRLFYRTERSCHSENRPIGAVAARLLPVFSSAGLGLLLASLGIYVFS